MCERERAEFQRFRRPAPLRLGGGRIAARRFLVACGLLAACAGASAQPAVLDAAQRSTLERVALGKARSEMLDAVRALPLTGDLNIGQWAGARVSTDRALRNWVRTRPAAGAGRIYSDNVCEVDLGVDPDAVCDALLSILATDGPGPAHVDERMVKAAARNWRPLWTTGVSTPPEVKYPNRPAGWEDITSEGIELARAAATADAHASLLDEAGRLRVTAARRLREFIDSSEAVRAAMAEALIRESRVTVAFDADQVATAMARIAMRDLLRVVTDVHASHYQGDTFAAADFREMLLVERRDALEATGMAVPPRRTVMRNPYALIEKDVPEWAGRTLTATGRYVPDEGEELDAAGLAAAARVDAIDALRREVEKLVIQQNVTLAAFVSYHESLKSDIVLWLGSARLVGPPRSIEGGVEVQAELRLRRLWEIVRRGMTLVEEDPEPTTQPGA